VPPVARLSPREAGGSVAAIPPSTVRMHIRLEPQGKELTVAGRRRVGELVRSLGLVTGTVMVIRGEDLLTDDDMVEDDEAIELRAVISGGSR
jgi:sulfur carrier protein